MYTYELQSGIHTASPVSARERYTNPQKTCSIKNIAEYWRRFNYSNVSGANTVKPPAKLNLNLSCKLQQWAVCTIYIFESETIMLKHTRENYICDFVSSSLKSGKQFVADGQGNTLLLYTHCFHPEFISYIHGTCNFRAPLSSLFLWKTVSGH
jgi:hypothetical protein